MFQVIGGRSVQVSRLLAPRSAVLVEAVRGRKSRTDPVAKSKEGRIKVPPPVDPREMVVLKERFSEYQLITRALRYVMRRGRTSAGHLGLWEVLFPCSKSVTPKLILSCKLLPKPNFVLPSVLIQYIIQNFSTGAATFELFLTNYFS